jgi:hypothetical protein
MAFNKPQHIDAPGGAFNHVLGNQYNITTTSHATALQSSAIFHPYAFDNDKVSVSVNFRYHDRQPVSTHVFLTDAKVSLNYSDGRLDVGGLDQDLRSRLGEWNCDKLTFVQPLLVVIHVIPTFSPYVKVFLLVIMLVLRWHSPSPRFKSPMIILVMMPNPEVVCVYHRMSQSILFMSHTSESYCSWSSTQTFAEYWKAYRSYHKLLERKRSSTSRLRRCDKNEPYVEMAFASLKFRRTLRIPDDAQEYLLPPVSDTWIIFTCC